MEISRAYAWQQAYDHAYERFYEYLSCRGHRWLARKVWDIERKYKISDEEAYGTVEKFNDIKILYHSVAERVATRFAHKHWGVFRE